jgi:hypothetical protein
MMCGPTAKAEQEGVIGITFRNSVPSIAALLPNGVRTMILTKQDGTYRSVPVTNNVIMTTEEPDLASISYQLANGVTDTIPIEYSRGTTGGPGQESK